MKDKIKLKYVSLITFLVGFFSFVLLSIYYRVFWVNSSYDVPLIYNVSVMIGDSILLPIINYKVFNLYFNVLERRRLEKKLVYWLIFVFIISTILNVSTHLTWVNDKFTDFIGFTQGEFSFIGYWHLIFSIFQMSILLGFPYLWYLSIKERNKEGVKYSINIWVYFFFFTLLNFFDLLNKYLFVYNDTLLYTIKNEGYPFISSILAIILLIGMKFYQRRLSYT